MTKSTHSLSFRKKDALNNFYTNHERAHRYSQKSTSAIYTAKQEAVEKQNDLILKKIIDTNRRTTYSHYSSGIKR